MKLTEEQVDALYQRYLGTLGVLAECSVYVTDDERDSITQAFEDACANYPLRYRRILDRLEITPAPPAPKAER